VLPVIAMLKGTPEDRLRLIDEDHARIATYSVFAIYAVQLAIFVLRHGNLPDGVNYVGFLLFALGCVVLMHMFTPYLWLALTAWLGRLGRADLVAAFRAPNRNPQAVDHVLESWWRNESTVMAFLIVLRAAASAGLYVLLGPAIGIL
jgi:hypothetical protein